MGIRGKVHWSNAKYEDSDPGHCCLTHSRRCKIQGWPSLRFFVNLENLLAILSRWRPAVSRAAAIFIYLGTVAWHFLFSAGETTIRFYGAVTAITGVFEDFMFPCQTLYSHLTKPSYCHMASKFFFYWTLLEKRDAPEVRAQDLISRRNKLNPFFKKTMIKLLILQH